MVQKPATDSMKSSTVKMSPSPGTQHVDGSFTISDDGKTLENADFTVDLSTVATDSDRRDNYFKNTALETSTYPQAELKVTDPVDLGEAATSGETKTVEVTGDLIIKGTTKKITFPSISQVTASRFR